MDIQKVKLVYFSPTGTSRKVMESIAVKYVEQVDIFFQKMLKKQYHNYRMNS